MPKTNHISKEKLRYSQITPYIYVGTNMLQYSHFERLKKLGISVDIDLESEHVEKVPMRGLDIFLWLPIKDGHAPSHDQMAAGVAFLDQIVRHRKKVYVHCKNGHGRAPTLVAAYLTTQGMMPEKAIAFVKKKRPVVHFNKEQTRAIKKFAKLYSLYDKRKQSIQK